MLSPSLEQSNFATYWFSASLSFSKASRLELIEIDWYLPRSTSYWFTRWQVSFRASYLKITSLKGPFSSSIALENRKPLYLQ